MKTYKYRGYIIEPKRDFPPGFKGKGWVVTDGDIVNLMPGACWFTTVPEAKGGIDALLKVKGRKHWAERFWEIMQPFGYKVGQRVPAHEATDSTVKKGRWTATIKDGVVTSVTKVAWKNYTPSFL